MSVLAAVADGATGGSKAAGVERELPSAIEHHQPDIRLLLDVSPQADRLDPDNARADAVSFLIQALPDSARAGIWTFAEEANPLVAYRRTDLFWKRDAVVSTRALESQGEQARLLAAIEAATWDLAESAGGRRDLIVVTAGVPGHASGAEGALATSDLPEEVADELAAANVRVHAILLPGAIEDSRLKQLVARTGGMMQLADRPESLGRLFERLTLFTSRPPQIAVEAGGFLVEPGLRELTLRIDGDDPRLILTGPDGRTHTRPKPGEGVEWHDARGFDVITVKRPSAGTWSIRGSDQVTAYAWGDLALKVGSVPAILFAGNLNTVDFMLFQGEKPLTDEHFRSMTRASARLVGDGGALPLAVMAAANGLYRVDMVGELPLGRHVLDLRIEAPTFSRKAAIPIELVHPVQVHVVQRGQDLVAWLRVADSAVDHRSLKVAVQYRVPPGQRKLLGARPMPGGLWQVTIPGVLDDVEFAWSVFGRYRNQKRFELHTEPLLVPVPVPTERVFGFDAAGRPSPDDTLSMRLLPAETAAPASDAAADAAAPAEPAPEPEAELPVWFVLLIGLLNVGVIGGLGWMVTRGQPNPDVQAWLRSRDPDPAPVG